jgi:hypothetical protein
MATPSIMRRLGDKAKTYSPFPDQSDYEGLKEKEKNIEAVSGSTQKPAQKPVEQEPDPSERLNPTARYGDRPGEKRLEWALHDDGGSIDLVHNKIPLSYGGSVGGTLGVDERMAVQNKTLHPFGNATEKQANHGQTHGATSTTAPQELGLANDQEDQNAMQEIGPATSFENSGPSSGALGSIPIHDDGGLVDLDGDGKADHEEALLSNGERVLTPKQNVQYTKEHPEVAATDGQTGKQRVEMQEGAPAGFAGRVIPNPDNVQPQGSEEPLPTERISGGAKMNTQLAPLTTPEGNIQNTEGNQAEAMGHEASANVPASETMGRRPKLDPNSPAGQLIQHDKEQAAMKGDLVGLGTAILNEKHLATDVGANHKPGELSYKERLKDYDKRIQEAYDKAANTNDPAFQEQADRLKLAKMEYQKANPWGSAANHPGVLGKIGHYLSEAGQIAATPFIGGELALAPGTMFGNERQRNILGQALRSDTEARLQQEAEQNKLKIAQAGRTPEQKAYNDLLGEINPDTNKLYTPEEALARIKGDEAGAKEKDAYIQDEMKKVSPTTGQKYTREEATENYYKMRAGAKPPNEQEQGIRDYLAAHHLDDSPTNRDLARQEIIRRKTDIEQRAALPYAKQREQFQNELAEAKAAVDRSDNKALARGEKLDDLTYKEKQQHNATIAKIDAAQNALDKSDTNMLAASIVPVLATMVETTAQGIKRLNPQELARFMPKSSGDAKQWFEANYDKLVAGQIPEQYRSDLRELLNNIAKEENSRSEQNLHDINQTFGEGATTPVVNTTSGRADKTKPAKSTEAPKEQYRRDPKTNKVQVSTDGGNTWK